jgi:hypothetical protein
MTSRLRGALLLVLPVVLEATPVRAASGTLPVGTVLPVTFETTVSSATSHPEEKVLARLRPPVRVGAVTLPEGSELRGHVISVRRSGKVKGGGGAGTGVVLATRGKEVSIPAGSRWRVRLVRPLVVD